MKTKLIEFLLHLRKNGKNDLVHFMIDEGEEILNAETYLELTNLVYDVTILTGLNYEKQRSELVSAILDSVYKRSELTN